VRTHCRVGTSGKRLSTGSKLLVERLGEFETEMDRLRLELGEVEARLRSAAGFRYEAEHVAEILDGFLGPSS
jgi:hypothetical protein